MRAAGGLIEPGDMAKAVLFMLTRPRNVAIRDLVILPLANDLSRLSETAYCSIPRQEQHQLRPCYDRRYDDGVLGKEDTQDMWERMAYIAPPGPS